MRGLLDRDEVLEARRVAAERLSDAGHLRPDTEPMDCIAAQGCNLAFLPDMALDNAALMRVLYKTFNLEFGEIEINSCFRVGL